VDILERTIDLNHFIFLNCIYYPDDKDQRELEKTSDTYHQYPPLWKQQIVLPPFVVVFPD
jgi:hypothetical protein